MPTACTVAPPTTAPFGSVTVPYRSAAAACDCATADEAKKRAARITAANLEMKMLGENTLIVFLLNTFEWPGAAFENLRHRLEVQKRLRFLFRLKLKNEMVCFDFFNSKRAFKQGTL